MNNEPRTGWWEPWEFKKGPNTSDRNGGQRSYKNGISAMSGRIGRIWGMQEGERPPWEGKIGN